MFGTARQKLTAAAVACFVGVTALVSAATVWVDGSFAGTPDGSEANPWPTIQEGVDNAADGDTIFIKAGTYADPVDIDNRADLTLQGEDRDTVIMEPTTLVNWNAFGHTTARRTAIRVFESTDITVKDLTIDMNIVTANGRYAIFYAHSTGEVDNVYIHSNNTGTTAYGIYVRADAAPYEPSNRAVVAIRNSEIRDAGRVGIGSHDYTHLIIDNNEIYKTECFPGYGVDLSSHSTGDVTNNAIHGHNARFPSDGSMVSGIYISNAFTNPTVPGITKDILVANNHIYNNMAGLVIGNQWNNFAGDVQIVVTLENNNISDNNLVCNAELFGSGNATYGMIITDEDAENGSSVTVNASGNNISNNGDYGVFQYGVDDADVTTNFTNNIITGHEFGVVLMDFGTSPTQSTHSMTLTENNISDNEQYNAYTDGSAGTDIEANDNYWGESGPGGTVSGGVTVTTFLTEDPTAPDFETFEVSALDTTNIADPAAYTNSVNLFSEFSYSGNEAHVLYVSESSDFSTSTPIALSTGQTTATLTVSSGDGLKTVYAKLGHYSAVSTALSDTILLDTVAPVTEATAPSGVVDASSPVIDVEFTANDAGSGIQNVTVYYQFDGGAWTELGSFASSPVPFNVVAAGGFGEYGFYTVGMDNAGNEESKAPDAEVTAQIQADAEFYQLVTENGAVAAGDSLLLEDVADDDLINGVTGTVVAGGFHGAYTGGPAPITDGTWNTDGLTALASDSPYPNPSLEIEWDFTDFVQGYVSVASIDKVTIFAGHAGDGARAFINAEVEVDTGSGYVSIGDALVTGPFGQPMPGEDTITFVTRDDLNLTGVERIKFRFWSVSHNSTGFFQAHDDNTTNPPLNYPNQGTIIKEIDVFGELDSVTSVNEWFMLD